MLICIKSDYNLCIEHNYKPNHHSAESRTHGGPFFINRISVEGLLDRGNLCGDSCASETPL